MRGLAGIAAGAGAVGLEVLGALHPGPGDGAPEGCGTLVLLGPDGAGFWELFRGSPEYRDGRADPLDRWSERVIGGLAAAWGAEALFPFGGPPWRPFTGWARASGEAWASPVGLLVHARRGLLVSYRGALALAERLALPRPVAGSVARPCDGCAAPCLAACPAGALTGAGYDVPACHGWLDSAGGRACLEGGCRVRRVCPVGQGLQPEVQSAFHMAAFHGRQRPCDG